MLGYGQDFPRNSQLNEHQVAVAQGIIHDYNLQMVVLTCGVNGSYIITTNEVLYRPTPKVDVVDTVGAGDSFNGAFVASLLKGKSLEEAHRNAVDTSAFVCTESGAMPSY